MNEFIIEMRHITKRFPGVTANDDISIQIKKGEIFALLGENGAGKSTLMSMLFGMYEPDEGEIWVRGRKERIDSPNYAAKLNIGMVHQHFKLVSNYTAAENMILGKEPMKRRFGLPCVDQTAAELCMKRLSQQFGLRTEPDKRIEDLPVSAQQRVEILKMLYREAEILIFDEPTAVLTPQEIDGLLVVMEALKKKGKTIILITHKLNEIKRIADRCAILCRGHLKAVLDVRTTKIKEMAKQMIGSDWVPQMQKISSEFGAEVFRAENLTVENLDQVPMIQGVSFTIHAGEIFAIAGVAGNGQTELADAIYGLQKEKEGKLWLNGREITACSIGERIQKGIGYIPEDRHRLGLILDFTLEENYVLKVAGQSPFCRKGILNRQEIRKFGETLSKHYDVRSSQGLATILRSMSGGNQQKAVVAREIAMNASLLLVVQPTRGLDIGAIDRIHQYLLAERNKGKAILLISLELEEILACADTIGVLYQGRMNCIAAAKSITKEQIGEAMMGVNRE